MITDIFKNEDLHRYASLVERVCKIKKEYVIDTATKLIRFYRHMESDLEICNLEKRWYQSLDLGSPDYDVYKHDQFTAELWAC